MAHATPLASLPIGAAAPDVDPPAAGGGPVRLGDLAHADAFDPVRGCNHRPVGLARLERLKATAPDDADPQP